MLERKRKAEGVISFDSDTEVDDSPPPLSNSFARASPQAQRESNTIARASEGQGSSAEDAVILESKMKNWYIS